MVALHRRFHAGSGTAAPLIAADSMGYLIRVAPPVQPF
jgi:hypothetical protein